MGEGNNLNAGWEGIEGGGVLMGRGGRGEYVQNILYKILRELIKMFVKEKKNKKHVKK